MSTWGLLKRIAGNKVRELGEMLSRGQEDERIDKNLPLGLRFSAMVEVPETLFILGVDAGLKVICPKGKGIVTGYGTFKLDPYTIHRFYLTYQDDQVFFLQVVVNGEGEVDECKIFMPWDEVYPPEEEKPAAEFWDFFLNEEAGYIGYSIFQSNDDQKTRYQRAWQHTGPGVEIGNDELTGEMIDRKPPVNFTETLYLDRFGKEKESVEYTAMMYGRAVNDDVDEYLLVAVVEDKDGSAVRLSVGVDLNPASLTVI